MVSLLALVFIPLVLSYGTPPLSPPSNPYAVVPRDIPTTTTVAAPLSSSTEGKAASEYWSTAHPVTRTSSARNPETTTYAGGRGAEKYWASRTLPATTTTVHPASEATTTRVYGYTQTPVDPSTQEILTIPADITTTTTQATTTEASTTQTYGASEYGKSYAPFVPSTTEEPVTIPADITTTTQYVAPTTEEPTTTTQSYGGASEYWKTYAPVDPSTTHEPMTIPADIPTTTTTQVPFTTTKDSYGASEYWKTYAPFVPSTTEEPMTIPADITTTTQYVDPTTEATTEPSTTTTTVNYGASKYWKTYSPVTQQPFTIPAAPTEATTTPFVQVRTAQNDAYGYWATFSPLPTQQTTLRPIPTTEDPTLAPSTQTPSTTAKEVHEYFSRPAPMFVPRPVTPLSSPSRRNYKQGY